MAVADAVTETVSNWPADFRMHLSPTEISLNMQLTSSPMEADLHTYGFPAGYFVVKNVATGKLLDVESDMVEDGTPLILFPETENSLVEGAYRVHWSDASLLLTTLRTGMRKPESDNQVRGRISLVNAARH